jgi:hypothetical protein
MRPELAKKDLNNYIERLILDRGKITKEGIYFQWSDLNNMEKLQIAARFIPYYEYDFDSIELDKIVEEFLKDDLPEKHFINKIKELFINCFEKEAADLIQDRITYLELLN